MYSCRKLKLTEAGSVTVNLLCILWICYLQQILIILPSLISFWCCGCWNPSTSTEKFSLGWRWYDLNRNLPYLSFLQLTIYVVIGKWISVCNTKYMLAGAEPVLDANSSFESQHKESVSISRLCMLLFHSALKWVVRGKCKLMIEWLCQVVQHMDWSIWSNHNSKSASPGF